MRLTERQLRRLIFETLQEIGSDLSSESPDDLATSLVSSMKRGRVTPEALGNGEIYIMTGQAQGITVKAVRRGK